MQEFSCHAALFSTSQIGPQRLMQCRLYESSTAVLYIKFHVRYVCIKSCRHMECTNTRFKKLGLACQVAEIQAAIQYFIT